MRPQYELLIPGLVTLVDWGNLVKSARYDYTQGYKPGYRIVSQSYEPSGMTLGLRV